MTITIHAQGAQRKRLVKTISDWLGAPAKYCGAPTFNYEVDYFTIDRNGSVTVKLSPTGTVILTARSLCWISTIPVWASAMQTRCPLQSRYATIGVLLSCSSHRHHLLNVTLLANLLTLAVKKHSGR